MKLAKRVETIHLAPTRKYNKIAMKAEQAGKTVYQVNIGQSDVETPGCFMEAIRQFDQKVLSYTETAGMNELLDAVIHYNRIYNIHLERENIIVTNGGSEALMLAFQAILDPGDAVMMAEPFYAGYSNFCESAKGVLVPITTCAENGYAWADRTLLESALTPDTKAICCNSPGNPTGRVLSLDEMRVIGEFAKEHDLWIVSDEVYREFTYDNRETTSFGMLPEYEDRVIIVDSVSKKFSACGARIGVVFSKNEHLIKGVLKLAQSKLSVPILEQIGATALYNLKPAYFDGAKKLYEQKRDAAYAIISRIPGVVCQKPGGAFYLMAKLPIEDAEDFLRFMLTEFEEQGETVLFTPAKDFYKTSGLGRNEIRIAYVLEIEKMKRAAELIKLGLKAYSDKKAFADREQQQ